MRSLLLCALVLVPVLPALAQPPAGAGTVDPTPVAAEVLGRLDAAWNAADGKRFAAEFTVETDVINIFGTHYRTRSDVAERMQVMLDTAFKGSVHRTRTLEAARYLAADLILVLSSAEISRPSAPDAKSRQTFILIRTAQGWQIRHWHNTVIGGGPPPK